MTTPDPQANLPYVYSNTDDPTPADPPPSTCAGCGRPSPAGLLCAECRAKFEHYAPHGPLVVELTDQVLAAYAPSAPPPLRVIVQQCGCTIEHRCERLGALQHKRNYGACALHGADCRPAQNGRPCSGRPDSSRDYGVSAVCVHGLTATRCPRPHGEGRCTDPTDDTRNCPDPTHDHPRDPARCQRHGLDARGHDWYVCRRGHTHDYPAGKRACDALGETENAPDSTP